MPLPSTVDCCRFELWDVNGPTSELRERVTSGDLPTEVLVLMRVALDLYDGSGGNLSFAEARGDAGSPGRDERAVLSRRVPRLRADVDAGVAAELGGPVPGRVRRQREALKEHAR